MLRVHEPSNEAAQRAITRLLETLHGAFLEDGECVLVKSGDQLFVNGERMRHVHEVTDFMHLLERLELGGMEFTSPPEAEALTQFLLGLARRSAWEAPEECFVEPIAQDLPSQGASDSDVPRPERVYKRSISEMRAVFREANDRGTVSVRRARRVSGNVMEALSDDESTLFGLMAIRDHDQYTFQHCVNVCALSTALGMRLGLSREATRELGVAGLLHDVGKLSIPHRILNKPGRLTMPEWEVMQSHPAAGARMLLKDRGLASNVVKAVKVALHHHIRYDGGGYPSLTFSTAPSILSRVVTVADCYDAMTSVRVYRKTAIQPANVVSYLWSQRGRAFHPAIVKRFVAMVGAYPTGSVVKLSDGSHAVVTEAPKTDDPFRPTVRRWGGGEPLDLGVERDVYISSPASPDEIDASDDEIAGYLRAA